MKVIKQILILFVCLISTTAFPQTRIVDSLVQKVNLAKTSDEKLQALLILCEQHQNIEKNSLLEYAILTQGLVKQRSKENKGLAAIAYINALMRFDKTDTAKSIIDALLPDYSVKNERERPLFFRLSELKSDCYTTVSNYRDAVSIIYTTIKEAEKYKDTLVLATGYNSLGEIAYNRNMLEEARQWQYKALAITQQQPRFYAPAAVANINLGIVYNWMEALDSARYCADQSIAISQSIQNLYYLCNAYMVIATNYRHKKNYTEAERWMLQAMEIRKKTEGRIVFSNEQLSLGNLYFRSGQYDKAIQVYKDGLTYDDSLRQTKDRNHNTKSNLEIKQYYYQGLARCYKATNQLALYGDMLERFIELKDTLSQINAADAMADMQVKYETQKKENTIIQQQLDLAKKNNLLYGSIGLIAALAIIFAILFWSYKSRQELKLQQQIEEDRWLTQQEVAKAEEKERSRIAADLHDNLGVYAASIASNLNHIRIDEQHKENVVALNELRNNSQAIVSQLSDTIWVLKKEVIVITSICDRVKLLISRIQKSFPDIEFNISEDIDNDLEFTASHAYHLYRIIQEAINNALKHSQCSKIDIHVYSHDNWSISIADNGIGISQTSSQLKEGGNGLVNMQVRGAEAGWTIEWLKNETGGTKVIITPTTN